VSREARLTAGKEEAKDVVANVEGGEACSTPKQRLGGDGNDGRAMDMEVAPNERSVLSIHFYVAIALSGQTHSLPHHHVTTAYKSRKIRSSDSRRKGDCRIPSGIHL